MKQHIAAGIALAAALLIMNAPANAGLGERMHAFKTEGLVDGKFRSNNVIRATATSRAYANINLGGKALLKLAEMAQEKGFSRFAVTKNQCSQMLVYGTAVTEECRLVAQMIKEGETVQPDGKNPVEYYDVSKVLGNQIAS
jgi:hypothetical protein